MEPDGLERYRLLMENLKLRITLIENLMTGKFNLPDVPLIESTALQFRKILELMAFGSLVANEKVYRSTYANFAKEWNAKKLLVQLGKLNSNFYPVPVKQVHPEKPSDLMRYEKLTRV